MDPQIFHDKLKALKPNDELAPEAVFVAILLHENLPSDQLAQADALWIKCPKSKQLHSLLKAYKKSTRTSDELLLRHDLKVVELNTTIGILAKRSSTFVALEAIRPCDVTTRNLKIQAQRAPLADVSNKARTVSPAATSIKVQSGSADRRPALTTPRPNTSTSLPAAGNHDGLSVPRRVDSTSAGWTDFGFERREHNSRQTPPLTLATCDANSSAEWLSTLTQGQRSYFADRERRILNYVVTTADHRAFWAFYYERYHAHLAGSSIDAHSNFNLTRSFTDDCITVWRDLTYNLRFPYLSKVANELEHSPLAAVLLSNGNNTGSTTTGLAISQRPDMYRRPSSPITTQPTSTIPRVVQSGFASPAEIVPPMASTSSPECPPENTVKKEVSQQPTEPTTALEVPFPHPTEPEAPRVNISDLFANCTAQQLENGVDRGVGLLRHIRETLNAHPSQEGSQWLQMIENVSKQAARTKTVVGVVGATGAGKSSVINAMLDEERLVPTNCMRACTAVVTEISYNSDDEAAYKAEIEFIERADWAKELKILFQDLLDGTGQVSRECSNEDSEAGIAYAKLKAVYPKLTKDDLANTTVEKLMSHDNARCLGSLRNIESQDSGMFYKKLQFYVDSKEKNGSKDQNEKEKKKSREMEHWPLIRVVRLYVKAQALSTGAVIVDLPGVHDSNQARAAVAQNYLKQCTGLWIVAPITRAVDDKSAKTLLGDSFKRQLKMDGGYNSVTFICSKTDDISITEAQDSLGLEIGPMYERWDELRQCKKSLSESLAELKDTKSDIAKAMDEADEEVEVWEKLQEDLNDGKTVYKPKPKSQKRKRDSDSQTISRKKFKGKHTEPDSDADFVDDGSDEEEAADHASSASDESEQEEVSADFVIEKIAELRATKKHGRRQKAELEEHIRSVRSQMKKLTEEQDSIDAELSAKCISGRNDYSRGAIQTDFAAGVKDIDEELAQEEDPASFDPEVDARDYDEVARSLPVFCVSSRAYQKLQGRLQKDKAVSGFKDVDETEIPALQRHCQKLTEAGRQAAARGFINKCGSLLNSLQLWASSDGSSRNLSEGQLKNEAKILEDQLKKLDQALDGCVQKVITAISEELEDNLYDIFPTATDDAMAKAGAIASNWGRPVNRDDRSQGGLYWATYKAVVRRDGVFNNAQGLHDFNEQLTEPVIKHIAGPWERTFSRKVPTVFAGLPVSGGQVLTDFHNQVEGRAVKNGASIAAFQMLKSQIPNHKEALKDASAVTKSEIVAKQKDINREFVPTITENMQEVYGTCTRETGAGSFVRMKVAMDRHVNTARHSMYDESTKHVHKLLKKMLREAEDGLHTKIDEIFNGIKRDYTSVVVGADVSAEQLLPREQRLLRQGVLSLVEGAESVFKGALDMEKETEDKTPSSHGVTEDREVEPPSSKEQEDTPAFKSREASAKDPASLNAALLPEELSALLEPNKVADESENNPRAHSTDQSDGDSIMEDALPSKLDIAKAADSDANKENDETGWRPSTAKSNQSDASQRSDG